MEEFALRKKRMPAKTQRLGQAVLQEMPSVQDSPHQNTCGKIEPSVVRIILVILVNLAVNRSPEPLMGGIHERMVCAFSSGMFYSS